MGSSSTGSRVGSAISAHAIVASSFAIILIAGGVLLYLSATEELALSSVVVATGPETGTYYELGTALGELLESEGLTESVTVRATEGSVTNMGLIETGAADLAIIQSDTRARDHARLVASLYEEVLHILIAVDQADRITGIRDLAGRRVVLGLPGSGTRQVARTVLDHFRVTEIEDLALDPASTARALEEGTVDAAFLLTSIPSAAVLELVEADAVRFLSLGDSQEVGNEADAVALVFPALHATTIPRSTYGTLPQKPVQSIGVTAQLVATSRLDGGFVRRLTEELIQHRSRLAGDDRELSVAARIREHYRPDSTNLPYHAGAVEYYERSQPPFLVEYAEAISLGLTLMVGLYSGFVALREWMRRKRKNRIDEYYLSAVEQAVDPGETDVEILSERRRSLIGLRRTAFADLVAEKLDANESFSILLEYIDSELDTIDRRLRRASEAVGSRQ